MNRISDVFIVGLSVMLVIGLYKLNISENNIPIEKLSLEDRCSIMADLKAKNFGKDKALYRYDPLVASCYLQYLDESFWGGVDCLNLKPGLLVLDYDVAEAMEHNSELCQKKIVEIKIAEF